MTQRTCSSCGAHVADVDDRCRACGSDPDLRLLELGIAPRRGPPTTGRPRSASGGWRGWAPVAAGVAVVWGVLAFLGGSGEEPSREMAEGSSTSRARATSTTARPGSTTSTTEVLPGAPLLGEPSGWELVVVAGTGQVVDLDTGGITVLRAHVVGTTDRGILVQDPDGLLLWPPPYDGSQAAIVLSATSGSDIEQVWVVGDGTLVWAIEWPQGQSGPLPMATANLVGLDGRVLGRFEVPAEGWPLGAIEDRLVLGAPGGIYLVDPAGDAERVSTGDAGGVVGDRIYASNCDEELRCRMDVLDGAGRLVDQRPSQRSNVGWAAAAPDGRIAYTEYRDDLNRVSIDGETVYVEPASIPGGGGTGALAWSPDGRWLAIAAVDGVHLLDTLGGTGERVVEVGFVDPAGFLAFVVPDR